MTDIIIGIDAGTSVVKAVAFTLAGEQIDVASVPNTYWSLNGAGVEQDMRRTWTDTVATLKDLAERVPDLAKRTAAIAVTGQGDGTWLIDDDGAPVAPGLLWLDARAAAIVDAFRSGPDDRRRFEITGTGLVACQQGPQLMWMMDNAPELLDRSATAFHCKDWLYLNLTGMRATDPSEGCFSFGDFRTRAYSDEVIGLLGLSKYRRLLPGMVDGTMETAPLTAKAATATGLRKGTPVALGFVDVLCTALGAGLYERDGAPGCTVVGSTGMHMRLVQSSDNVVLNDDCTGYTMLMPAPGVCAQMQSNMASTLNIDWLLDVASDLFASQDVDVSRADLIPMIDGWITGARPATMLFQPYVSDAGERGPFIDANARGGFIGLSSRHRFGDLVRAVVEGLALAARDCYSAMGAVPEEIRLTGGAARSQALRRIFAAVLGARTRTCAREEAGAAGAAMMAAVAIGQYRTMDDCVPEWVTPLLGDPEPPETTLTEAYDTVFPAYRQAREVLQPTWKTLADVKRRQT